MAHTCRNGSDMTGHLCVITGCMFAQKTTELLRRIRRYESIGYRVLTVNYVGDTRYGKGCISSHDQEQQTAVCVGFLSEVEGMVCSGDYRVVAIDEGQFFPDLFDHTLLGARQFEGKVMVEKIIEMRSYLFENLAFEFVLAFVFQVE